MGIYDTIIFPAPIKCKFCGEPIDHVQTKQFDPCMRAYYVGDLLECALVTGIVAEDVHCKNYQTHLAELIASHVSDISLNCAWDALRRNAIAVTFNQAIVQSDC